MTRSCIKLGNIPENSLTQAHKRDRSEHNRQRQSAGLQKTAEGETDNHREAV
jgi:hypothetical protein